MCYRMRGGRRRLPDPGAHTVFRCHFSCGVRFWEFVFKSLGVGIFYGNIYFHAPCAQRHVRRRLTDAGTRIVFRYYSACGESL